MSGETTSSKRTKNIMMITCEKTEIGAKLLIITVFLGINALVVAVSLQMITSSKSARIVWLRKDWPKRSGWPKKQQNKEDIWE